ncbi:cytochrome c oxidase subunit 3 [Sphingobium bisphenolivorans]|uniref:cytochrome c oxidase subunit 3 n=1 Tax=Sphingobium bisphenolivorans TaxID=1335760 RepID=UPI0003A1EF58|nr:cytochrome oxidase subunit III [Sphingobium bisphenolivorans]
MTLLARLTEKSWEGPAPLDIRDRPSAGAVGLVTYFAVALVMFSLLIAAYLMRMGLHSAMGHASDDWTPMPDPPLLWVNSTILLLSSAAWERARRSVGGQATHWAMIGAMLGLAFLCGQLLLWRHYAQGGYYLGANPANAFFYLLTALHGCHIAGGLAATARAFALQSLRAIGLCALYWHFLLALWIILAALLLST